MRASGLWRPTRVDAQSVSRSIRPAEVQRFFFADFFLAAFFLAAGVFLGAGVSSPESSSAAPPFFSLRSAALAARKADSAAVRPELKPGPVPAVRGGKAWPPPDQN